MTDQDPRTELGTAAAVIQAEVADRDPWLAELPVVGLGWATGELDRATEELASLGTFGQAGRDANLGATARRTSPADPSRPAVVLLEPDTESLLAATLARFGEGVRVVYLGRLDRADIDDTPRLGPARQGPLGPARLVIGRPAWGPHALVLAGVARRGRAS